MRVLRNLTDLKPGDVPLRVALRNTAAVVAPLAIGIAFAAVGELLSQRISLPVGPPPAELHARSFTLRDRVSDSISGWLSRGTPGAGAPLIFAERMLL